MQSQTDAGVIGQIVAELMAHGHEIVRTPVFRHLAYARMLAVRCERCGGGIVRAESDFRARRCCGHKGYGGPMGAYLANTHAE